MFGSPYMHRDNPDEPPPPDYPKCPLCGLEWHGLPEFECPGFDDEPAHPDRA
jgi:hypothetical protein